MKRQRIQIKGYPCTVEFFTRTAFPEFKYGCKVRTNEARIAIEAHGFDAPHDVDDFVVEAIRKTRDGEVWEIGS